MVRARSRRRRRRITRPSRRTIPNISELHGAHPIRISATRSTSSPPTAAPERPLRSRVGPENRRDSPGGTAMSGILPAGEGHLLTARGSVMAFKALGAQTGGDFSLMERTLPAGGRTPPAHRHTNCSEAFFVLDGEITFWIDAAEETGGPGDFLLVPRGMAHTFGNRSPEQARLLVLHAPA